MPENVRRFTPHPDAVSLGARDNLHAAVGHRTCLDVHRDRVGQAAGRALRRLHGRPRGAQDHRPDAARRFSPSTFSTRIWNVDWKRFPRSLLGPDTLVFQWRDVKDFFRHLGWILGLVKAPQFDRWSWWEKFDYWAVWWGLIIVGVTGLMLYNPVLSSEYMPGWLLNRGAVGAPYRGGTGHGPYLHHPLFHRALASALLSLTARPCSRAARTSSTCATSTRPGSRGWKRRAGWSDVLVPPAPVPTAHSVLRRRLCVDRIGGVSSGIRPAECNPADLAALILEHRSLGAGPTHPN